MSHDHTHNNRFAYLHNLAPQDLVQVFNKEVGNPHWVSSRALFLHELQRAFSRKCIDYSCVKNASGGFNLAQGNRVYLEGNKLELVNGRAFVDEVLASLAFTNRLRGEPKLRHVGTNHHMVTVADWFSEDYDGVFIIAGHGKPNTLLDLSGITHAYVLEMDFLKPIKTGWLPQEIFYAAHYCDAGRPGTFVQVVQTEHIVVVDEAFFDAQHKIHFKPFRQ